MEHWEFLLQKEGDRSWLPLDSPDVEILEGRYRIVARSSTVNATIDTRIAHLATTEVPPKRRVQKRTCRTNQDGLMVVIPFTHLEPGRWELSCSPTDLMTDLMTGAQPYAIKLQVVAREPEDDWEPDWTAPHVSSEHDTAPYTATSEASATAADRTVVKASEETHQGTVLQGTPALASSVADTSLPNLSAHDRSFPLPPEVAEILGASMDRLFQIAEQMSDQLVDEVLQDFDLTTIADAPVSQTAVAPDERAVAAPTAIDSTSINASAIASDISTNQSDESVAVGDRSASDRSANGQTVSNQTGNGKTGNDRSVSASTLPIGYTLAAQETFLLTLDQSAFVATRGEVITLSGQVAIGSLSLPASADATTFPPPQETAAPDHLWENDAAFNLRGATAQELQLCLRDPQSLQILVSDRQPLPPHSFPCPFIFSFSLPETFATHLVLGEVLLCGTLSKQTDAPIALLTQAFSITVDPNALVGELDKLHEALAREVDDEERLDLPLELSSRLKEQATPSLDLSFLNAAVAESPEPEQTAHFPSLAGQPLPPRLYQPDPEQTRSKTLDLPDFKPLLEPPSSTHEATTDPKTADSETAVDDPLAIDRSTSIAAEASITADSGLEVDRNTLNQVDETAAPLTTETARELKPLEPIDAETPKNVNADNIDSSTDSSIDRPTLDLPSPTNMAFQSLKLQDRFLTRLTSLATDTELSAMLKANLATESSTFIPTTTPSAADIRSLSEEIVVDDVPPQNERQRKQPDSTSEQVTLDEPPDTLVLPADDPVPMPTLEVTTGELTAGKSINIRVKLPNLLPRIYVKLWVTDRQTRSLLDGPRWLVDFLPNGLGALEAMIPLTVPFGSVELRFEAIAVEMHTQRESHKVTIDRLVVPPDLPIVSLDDFDA